MPLTDTRNMPVSGQNHRDAFFLCNRAASASLVAFSLLASCIGGTATLAMIALAAQAGWPAFWWLGSGALGLTILGCFFAKKIRLTRAATLPEVIDQWQDRKCRLLAGVIILLSSIAIVAAQFNALGVIISSLAHLNFAGGVIYGALAIAVYTCFGGQTTVMKSDIWQFILLAIALILCFGGFLANPACREALLRAPLHITSKSLPISRVIYFIFIFGSSFIIGPMIFGRILSAKTPRAAQRGTFLAATGLAIMALLITAIGIAISGLQLSPQAPEFLFSTACAQVLPGWINALVITGLLAAVISSADSCLLGAAMIWTNDIRNNGSVNETRAAIIIIAIISAIAVFCGKSILSLLLAASDIFTCGIVAPSMIMLLGSKKTDSRLFLCAIILGGSLGILAAITSNYLWSFAGISLSALICLAGKQFNARAFFA